jgi:hypothetical protein
VQYQLLFKLYVKCVKNGKKVRGREEIKMKVKRCGLQLFQQTQGTGNLWGFEEGSTSSYPRH